MGEGIILPQSDSSTQQQFEGMRGRGAAFWRPPSPAAMMPFPFFPVLTICLIPILLPCYASAPVACPQPLSNQAQLGNQSNVKNA